MLGTNAGRFLLLACATIVSACGTVASRDAASEGGDAGADTVVDRAPGSERDAPATDTPAPAADAPAGDTPAADAPAADAPAADAPIMTPDAATDGAPDAAAAACDLSRPFGAARALVTLNTAGSNTDGIWLSRDGLTAYLSSRLSGALSYDIFTATRASLGADFSTPTLLAPVSTASDERSPVLAPDGLTLLFYRRGTTDEDIYVSTRANLLTVFSAASAASVINAAGADENNGSLTSDGRVFYFSSRRSGTFRIYRATIGATGEFQQPVDVGELNPAGTSNGSPIITSDQLAIYFSRVPQNGTTDIMFARRSTVADGFGTATPVAELNSAFSDWPDYLTADGCTIYFTSNRASSGTGGYELFVASRSP